MAAGRSGASAIRLPGAKTSLLYAAREGHLDIVQLLLSSGARLEKADADGVTPLLMAVLNGQLPVGDVPHRQRRECQRDGLVRRDTAVGGRRPPRPRYPGPHQGNGVDRAAAFELIRMLLAHGAHPDARTKEYPPQRRWITRLGSLSWVDFTGQTPFLRAALAGDVEVMHLLLEHHADPNITTFNGTTPLMAAAGVNWTVAQTYDEGPDKLLEAVKLAAVARKRRERGELDGRDGAAWRRQPGLERHHPLSGRKGRAARCGR